MTDIPAQLRTAIASGMTMRQFGESVGLKKDAVRRLAIRNGLRFPPRRIGGSIRSVYTDSVRAEIANRRASGVRIKVIAREMGLSHHGVASMSSKIRRGVA